MKKQCLKCAFYSEDIDQLNNSMDDIIIENEPQEIERHYCLCYLYGGHDNRNSIPPEIWTGKAICKSYKKSM